MNPDSANVPCKDCTERHIRCHSECERYKEFKKRNAERLAREAKRVEDEGRFVESVIRRKEKTRRHHGTK